MVDNIIRISDPDQPIYRIFPFWFFEETLRTKSMTLAHPSTWEDPYELLGSSVFVQCRTKDEVSQEVIDAPFLRVFAQCWSATKESDTLLRAYSKVVKDPHVRRNILPREEGVRVSTSARKLLNALEAGSKEALAGQCYIGAVQYMSAGDLAFEAARTYRKLRKSTFEEPDNLVHFALLKREAFSHESEVRLILITNNQDQATKYLKVKVDPNTIFDEITFDPRLESFERSEREAVIRRLGYKGRIVESQLYESPNLSIFLTDD